MIKPTPGRRGCLASVPADRPAGRRGSPHGHDAGRPNRHFHGGTSMPDTPDIPGLAAAIFDAYDQFCPLYHTEGPEAAAARGELATAIVALCSVTGKELVEEAVEAGQKDRAEALDTIDHAAVVLFYNAIAPERDDEEPF